MARQYGTIFQVGTQQRSSPHFRHACELARNGYLGKVHTIEVAAPRGSSYPAVETLAKLKDAFAATNDADTRELILTRAAEIRDMAVVEWLTGFLDDAELSESACAAIAKLAHHRELREPNKAAFAPILEKVEKTAKDKAVAEAAQKARLEM